MENPLVIGILDIVEEKLREYNIQLPADEREGSNDPIVGYDYAELHDRIQEYLEDAGLLKQEHQMQSKHTVHVLSIVNSDGYANGKNSDSHAYASLDEFINEAYLLYKGIWEESQECGVLDSEDPILSQMEFRQEILKEGCICIQCLDAHVNFDYSVQEISLDRTVKHDRKQSLNELISSASSKGTASAGPSRIAEQER